MDFLEIKPTTKDELSRIMSALTTSGSLDEAHTKLPTSVYESIKKNVEKNGNYQEVVKSLKDYLATIKDIKVYLPYEPSKLLYEQILTLFHDVKPHRYLDFIVDESILGGVNVAIDGTFYDESLNSIIEKKLSANA